MFSAARLAPPATRERPPATRLITLLFYFCSLSRDSGARVNGATRTPFPDRWTPFHPRQESPDLTHDAHERRSPEDRADVIRVDLHGTVDFMVQPARRARRHDPVPPRPERQRRHRRLADTARKGRLVDVVPRYPLVEFADVGVRLVVARKGR